MRLKYMTTIFVLLLGAGFVALTLTLSTEVASVSAEQNGHLHLKTECSEYKGAAGDHCTFISSNLPQIRIGSKVFYDQAAGIPTGLLDSNVVLDAGDGNRRLAVARSM